MQRADGYLVREQVALLYRILKHLSGGQNVAHQCESFDIETLLRAIARYLPEEPKSKGGQP